jgi:hypothetical protein
MSLGFVSDWKRLQSLFSLKTGIVGHALAERYFELLIQLYSTLLCWRPSLGLHASTTDAATRLPTHFQPHSYPVKVSPFPRILSLPCQNKIPVDNENLHRILPTIQINTGTQISVAGQCLRSPGISYKSITP